MNDASSEARKQTSLATSSGVPMRSRICGAISSRSSAGGSSPLSMCPRASAGYTNYVIQITPGQEALQRTVGPRSTAVTLVSCATPPLVVQ